MRKLLLTALLAATALAGIHAQDTLWIKYNNRFKANGSVPIARFDSIEFRARAGNDTVPVRRSFMTSYTKGYFDFGISTPADIRYMFHDPGRIVWKLNSFGSMDLTNDASRWSFRRSKESDHFIVLWEKVFGDNPKTASNGFDPDAMLTNAEKIWDKYVADLGFITPGKSVTDKYKIIMFVLEKNSWDGSDWQATGSGEDYMSGVLNVTPRAITARGGHTEAHEIGHTFQYLTGCDMGNTSSNYWTHSFNYGYASDHTGNGWWESCANWQAYKVYPERQFTDGEYFEGNMREHHLNLLHETFRYENCFIQDWWCQLYGKDFIGRMWREALNPEDPVQVYKRMNNKTQDEFNDEMMQGFMHMATWDIDEVREQAKHRIGQEPTHMHKNGDYWEVDSAYCPQNYGYNCINLNYASPGTVVKANFKGIAGNDGYRKVELSKAGWRYGFVAYKSDGSTVYGDICKDKEGTASLTVPEGCTNLFFVVMGAPTEHFQHVWDDDVTNDEQWPYQVQFEGTNLYGQFGEYAADYQRRDTTIYIDAELAVANSYTSTTVNYDISAVSRCLGLSTEQINAVGRNKAANPRLLGANANGSYSASTTTTTSSSTVYGHWFDENGNVCSYNSQARIFAEYNRTTYKCAVGQYPNRLVKGNTYTARQAFQYDAADGKTYTVTFVVRLKAI